MASEAPMHLAANNRRVGDEVTVAPTRVVGDVPAELRGRFLRNGPNPRTGWSAHLHGAGREDDGYLVTLVHDRAEDTSYC